jgi:hypothetical protein
MYIHHVTQVMKTRNRKHDREHRTRNGVTNQMLRSVPEIAMYTEMHIRYNTVISRELHDPGTPLSLRYQILQYLWHTCQKDVAWTHMRYMYKSPVGGKHTIHIQS